MVASLASCRGDTEPAPDVTPSPTPTTTAETATPAVAPTATATAAVTHVVTATAEAAPASSAEDDIAAIRAIVAAYWKAFNDWDADRALLMLEPGYRATEEELIRHDIGRLEQFGVRLDVSEESPPVLNAEGDYETYVAMVTPIDTLRICMEFRHIGGEWWIVFSGVVAE